jgi:hypothetical protein
VVVACMQMEKLRMKKLIELDPSFVRTEDPYLAQVPTFLLICNWAWFHKVKCRCNIQYFPLHLNVGGSQL